MRRSLLLVVVLALTTLPTPGGAAAACSPPDEGEAPPGAWEPLVAPGSNAVRSLTTAPADPDRVLVAAAPRGPSAGGAYLSDDGGRTWTRGRGLLADTVALAVAFSPADRAVLYAGTEPTHDAAHPPEGEAHVSAFRSTDGGATWCAMGAWQAATTALHTDARRPATVWAGLADGRLWRSDDEGVTWQFATTPGTGAVLRILTGPAASDLFVVTGGGAFRSADGGRTFTRAQSGMEWPGNVFGIPPVQDVTQDPRDPAVLYATTAWGVYRSVDFGASWTRLLRPATQPHARPAGCRSSGAAFTSVAATASGTVVAGETCGVWVSRDGGVSWTFADDAPGSLVRIGAVRSAGTEVWLLAQEGLFVSRDDALSFDVAGPGWIADGSCVTAVLGRRRLLAECGGVVTRSADGGRTWSVVRGFPDVDVVAFTPDARHGNVVVAATRNDGFHRSTDWGASWQPILALPRAGAAVAAAPSVAGTFYAAASAASAVGADAPAGLWRTRNGGVTWEAVGAVPAPLLDALAVSPLRPDSLFAGGLGALWRSDDGGRTWTQAAGVGANSISAIGFTRGGGTVIAAGRLVFRSSDGGATFDQVAAIPEAAQSIAAHPARPDVVYLGSFDGLYRSSDGGGTWELADVSGVAAPGVSARQAIVWDVAPDPDAAGGFYLLTGPGYAPSPWTALYRTRADG